MQISKIGNVRLHPSRPVKAEIKPLRILRLVDGWFAQVVIEIEGQRLPENHARIARDVGIEKLKVLSNFEFVENSMFYKKTPLGANVEALSSWRA